MSFPLFCEDLTSHVAIRRMYDGDSSLASPTRVKNTHGQIRRACSTEVPAYLHTKSDLDALVSTMCVTRIRACRTMLTTPCVDNQPQSTAIHCASTTKMNQTLHHSRKDREPASVISSARLISRMRVMVRNLIASTYI